MNRRTSLISLSAIFCFCILAMLPACRSSRNASPPGLTGQPVASAADSNLSPKEQFKTLLNGYRHWSDVSMSVKCSLRSPKNLTISGKATMIRGREIRISFRMLGFEVGGLYADTDSIYFYEKLNRTIVVESMSRLTTASGLDLSDIQDVLLGRVTYPGARDSAGSLAGKFRVSDDGDKIILTPKASALPWHYTLLCVPETVLSSLSIAMPGKGEAQCSYAVPLATDAGPVSPSADISARYGKQSLEASFKWSLETASWNNGLSPARNLPKGYRRIPFAQLIKSLGSKQ